MRCPRCQHENRPQAKFCEVCASPFKGGSPTARSYVDLKTEVESLSRSLTEALEQQKATAELLQTRSRELAETQEQQTAAAEILRVISQSPTDVQPVFDAIAERAMHLCGARTGAVTRFDGELIHLAALANVSPEVAAAIRSVFPMPPSRRSAAARAVLTGSLVQVPDILEDPEYGIAMQAQAAFRSVVAVPMLHRGEAIGAVAVGRPDPGPFPERQIALLQTFAAQAVIAIENVRLFNETKESLEQQTATAEILRVIASSPTDIQAVFEVVAQNSARLCEAPDVVMLRVDGDVLRLVTSVGPFGATIAPDLRLPIVRGSVAGRAAVDRRTIHVHDLAAESEQEFSVAKALQHRYGHRTQVAVPLLREGIPLGVINVIRTEVRPFSDKQIALLETFAAQAVIAVENVRLFTELEARNRELTESLEQQTATGEILRVIASSPTDLEPVMQAVVENAIRVCGAMDSAIFRLEGEHLRLVARHGPLRTSYAIGESLPVSRDTVGSRVILERRTIHVEDILAAEVEFPVTASRARASGATIRTMVGTPLLREGIPLGVLFINRGPEPNPFSPKQIALLETFANQAVIAIENVRLFTELQEKNRALTQAHTQVTEALEQQTATSEVLKVISRSTFDLQPVLETLVENAARLCGAPQGFIFRSNGEVHQLAVDYNAPPGFSEWSRDHPIRAGDGSVVGRVAQEKRTVHVLDAQADAEWHVRYAHAPGMGHVRTVLGVPMLRQGALIGVFGMWREEVRPFTDKQLELVATFADQAVIAIENVRLLQELQARTDELARSVEELRALGEVGQAVSSTLDLQTVLTTIVSRAVELSGTSGGVIYEHDGVTGAFGLRASHQIEAELVEVLRGAPFRLGEGVTGRAAALRAPVQVKDLLSEREFAVAHISPIAEGLGYRSVLAVPLLVEDRVMGGLTVWRKQPGDFAPEVVHLLQTFGAQSSLAIQNARLFREIADKSRLLEAASRHKSEFLANMSHELRTPLNAILGFSEVLAERMFGEVNEKQAEYLQDILSSGRHLLSLINDILDLSKVEAGRLELELGRFHLPTALDNALTLVRERATRHGITLTQQVDSGVGDIVADERKVKQILLNLLSNAVKFTPEGGRVDLTATVADVVITIAVRDTGIGIAPEDQATIFEEFRQVGRDDARKQEGTGLGLTLAKKFVELHGGRIWVESLVGQGSTFTFTLPVRPDGRSAGDQGGGGPPPP